ncbi:hypothetical protein V6Z11_D11G226900 [Gossypium hirsutum]
MIDEASFHQDQIYKAFVSPKDPKFELFYRPQLVSRIQSSAKIFTAYLRTELLSCPKRRRGPPLQKPSQHSRV